MIEKVSTYIPSIGIVIFIWLIRLLSESYRIVYIEVSHKACRDDFFRNSDLVVKYVKIVYLVYITHVYLVPGIYSQSVPMLIVAVAVRVRT